MREGFIRIIGTDIFYDSIEKVYKKRMYCPYCRKVSFCWCFTDLDEALNDEAMMYDTDRCFVLDTDEAKEIGKEMGITVKPIMEEWNARKIVKVMMEDIEADWETINGEACQT